MTKKRAFTLGAVLLILLIFVATDIMIAENLRDPGDGIFGNSLIVPLILMVFMIPALTVAINLLYVIRYFLLESSKTSGRTAFNFITLGVIALFAVFIAALFVFPEISPIVGGWVGGAFVILLFILIVARLGAF